MITSRCLEILYQEKSPGEILFAVQCLNLIPADKWNCLFDSSSIFFSGMVRSHESSLDCISDGLSCHALWPSRFLQELDMKKEQYFMQAVAKRLGIPHDMAWWAVGCYSIYSSMFTCLWLSHASDIQCQLFVRWWFKIWVHYLSFLRSWPN